MPLQRADDAYNSPDRFSGVTAKIGVPVHMMDTVSKVVRTSRQLLNEIGREPTPEELAEKLGMTLEKMRKVLKIGKEPLSLETPIGDEEDSHLGDFIEDRNAILPIDAAIAAIVANNKARSGAGWFFLCLLLSPLAILVLLALPALNTKVCPRCAETVKSAA